MTVKLRKSKTLESYMGSFLLVAFFIGGVLGMTLTSFKHCTCPSEVSSPKQDLP